MVTKIIPYQKQLIVNIFRDEYIHTYFDFIEYQLEKILCNDLKFIIANDFSYPLISPFLTLTDTRLYEILNDDELEILRYIPSNSIFDEISKKYINGVRYVGYDLKSKHNQLNYEFKSSYDFRDFYEAINDDNNSEFKQFSIDIYNQATIKIKNEIDSILKRKKLNLDIIKEKYDKILYKDINIDSNEFKDLVSQLTENNKVINLNYILNRYLIEHSIVYNDYIKYHIPENKDSIEILFNYKTIGYLYNDCSFRLEGLAYKYSLEQILLGELDKKFEDKLILSTIKDVILSRYKMHQYILNKINE